MASLKVNEYVSPLAKPRKESKPGQIWCVGCTPDAGQRGTLLLLMNLTVSPTFILTILGVAVPLAKVMIMVWLLGVALAVGLAFGLAVEVGLTFTLAVGLAVVFTLGVTDTVGLAFTLTVGDSVGPGAIADFFLNTKIAIIIPVTTIRISIAFFISKI